MFLRPARKRTVTASPSLPPGSVHAHDGPTASRTTRQKIRVARLFVARHRRPLAAVSTAAAVCAGLAAVRPAPPPNVPVLVATRDLDTGAVPGPGDLRTARYPPGTAPDHVLRRPADTRGRALAAAVRRGEAITDVRLVGPHLRGVPGGVALPVRFADADAARLLRPGDRVDILAGPAPEDASAGRVGPSDSPAPARVVARDTTVLARPEGDRERDGGLLILSVPPDAAAAIAGAATTSPLTYTLRGSPSETVATGEN